MYHDITPEDLRVLTKHITEQGTPYTSRASRRTVQKLRRREGRPVHGDHGGLLGQLRDRGRRGDPVRPDPASAHRLLEADGGVAGPGHPGVNGASNPIQIHPQPRLTQSGGLTEKSPGQRPFMKVHVGEVHDHGHRALTRAFAARSTSGQREPNSLDMTACWGSSSFLGTQWM